MRTVTIGVLNDSLSFAHTPQTANSQHPPLFVLVLLHITIILDPLVIGLTSVQPHVKALDTILAAREERIAPIRDIPGGRAYWTPGYVWPGYLTTPGIFAVLHLIRALGGRCQFEGMGKIIDIAVPMRWLLRQRFEYNFFDGR